MGPGQKVGMAKTSKKREADLKERNQPYEKGKTGKFGRTQEIRDARRQRNQQRKAA